MGVPTTLRFRVLGETCVVGSEGREYAIRSLVTRGLLAVLLMDHGRVVPARRLLDTLWDGPPVSARANLRTHKRYLYEVLAAAGLADRVLCGARGAGGGYGLRVDETEVDVLAFRRSVADARALLSSGMPAAAAQALRAGLSLWHGRAGYGLPETNRVSALMQGLNDERSAAVEFAGQLLINLGDYHDAIAELARHVADEPARERGWVLLACAHYFDGNPATAEAMIRRGHQTLDHTLGLEPGPSLRAARTAVIRHDHGWFEHYLGGEHTRRAHSRSHLAPRTAGHVGSYS